MGSVTHFGHTMFQKGGLSQICEHFHSQTFPTMSHPVLWNQNGDSENANLKASKQAFRNQWMMSPWISPPFTLSTAPHCPLYPHPRNTLHFCKEWSGRKDIKNIYKKKSLLFVLKGKISLIVVLISSVTSQSLSLLRFDRLVLIQFSDLRIAQCSV